MSFLSEYNNYDLGDSVKNPSKDTYSHNISYTELLKNFNSSFFSFFNYSYNYAIINAVEYCLQHLGLNGQKHVPSQIISNVLGERPSTIGKKDCFSQISLLRAGDKLPKNWTRPMGMKRKSDCEYTLKYTHSFFINYYL